MITIHAAMLVILGFLLAALLLLVFLPAYRRRIERFSTETLKRSLPLTEAEIRAGKDRIRAEYAIDVHKLEMKLEEASLSAARQSVEINRREAKIHELDQAIDAQKLFVDEHENARRVLEQAIMDRLPKVEQRLAEARKLLVQRDRDIAALTESSATQTAAIEEATQINIQQADELHRVRAALETRAARNRETLGDPRFDGEVALRTEIEALRAKTREQSAMLERMQSADGSLPESLRDEHGADQTDRLKSALAKAEAELAGIKAGENSGAAIRSALESQTRELETRLAEQASELTRLKASLKAYEDAAQASESGQESPIPAMAELNALQAEAEEQRRSIQVLRAEVANSNDRLARQATHFRDELRRLGSASATAPSQAMRTVSEAPRRSLAERIAQPRIPAKLEPVETESSEAPAPGNGDGRQSGFLRALNGGAGHGESSGAATDESAPQQPASGTSDQAAAEATPRRPRLLERISGIDKS